MSWSRSTIVAGLCLVSATLLAGCSDILGDKDAHQPGDLLGTYHVAATRTSNTCGEGALGTLAKWEFDVKLARAPGVVFWNNGAQVISGALDDDDVTFHFDAEVLMDMRDETSKPGLPACSVTRRDDAKGTLSATDDDVESFTGALSFEFAPTPGSDCADLVAGPTPIVAQLPCAFAYGLAGERVDATK